MRLSVRFETLAARLSTTLLLILGVCAGAREPLHIVPIGDSITQGGREGAKEYTYRWPLARMLKDEGICFSFEGSHNSGLDSTFKWPDPWDADNEGYYGAKTAFVRDRLRKTLPELDPPDIALIHLGTNDDSGSVTSTVVDPMRDIVQQLRQRNQHVIVFIALIKIGALRGFWEHFLVRRLAAEISTPESPVVAVDQYTNWDVRAETFDGVHPNLRGQRDMAERWLGAMRPYLASASECQQTLHAANTRR